MISGYQASWSGNNRPIDNPNQVIELLASLHEAGVPTVVTIYRYDTDDGDEYPVGVQVGVGHPDRSFLLDTGRGYAVDEEVPAYPTDIEFSYGGEPTDYHPNETRLTPQRAWQLARHFVTTGQTPEGPRWEGRRADIDPAAASDWDDPWA